MAPKKKQPKNSFYFFVMDFKQQMAGQGIIYPNLREAFDAAGPEWQRLSKDQKNRYEEIAKEYKLNEQQTIHKYTTTGKTFEQVDLEAHERKAAQAKMEAEIKSTVAVLDKKGLQTKVFYLMHVNYFCRVDEKEYIPCELAMCQFNFARGAFNFYHTLIHPGDIPLGYAFEVKKRSDETHQIPYPLPNGVEKNYSRILLSIVRFLMNDEEHGKFPPVYTYGTDGTFEAVRDALDTLCYHEALQPEPLVYPVPEFRVYPLAKLFFELRNKAGDLANRPSRAFPVESLAARELEKNLYSFTPGICCEMHDGTDASQYCSLSLVRRWTFIVADHCCKDLGIDLAPGQHIPPPISHQSPRRTQAQLVVSSREEKKSVEPIIPTFTDHSKIKPTTSAAVSLVSDKEEKKSSKPVIPTFVDCPKTKPVTYAAASLVSGKEEKKPVDPMIPAPTDYSQMKPSTAAAPLLAEEFPSLPAGRGRTTMPNLGGVVRRPKSVGLALKITQPPPPLQSERDFPAIGGSSKSNSSSSLILGQTPLKVAGRGSSIGTTSNMAPRGRGICSFSQK